MKIFNLICYFVTICALSLISLSSVAGSEFHQSKIQITESQLAIDRLSGELAKRQFIDSWRSKQQQLKILQENNINQHILKHIQLDFIAAQAAVEGVNIALTDSIQSVQDTQSSIHDLEKKLQSQILLSKADQLDERDKLITMETELEILRKLLHIQNRHIQILNDIKATTEQRFSLEKNWQTKIHFLYTTQQQQRQHNRLQILMSELQQQQQQWLIKLDELNQQLQSAGQTGNLDDSNLRKLQLHILEAEEKVVLIRLKSYTVHLLNRIQSLEEEQNKTSESSSILNELSLQIADLLKQLNATQVFIEAKIKFLSMKKIELVNDLSKQLLSVQEMQNYATMLTDLRNGYELQTKQVTEIEKKAVIFQHNLKLLLQHHLSERQKFPADWNGWISLSQKMMQIPQLMITASRKFGNEAFLAVKQLPFWLANIFIFSAVILLCMWIYFRRYIATIEITILEKRQRFSTNVVYILLELARRNIGSVLTILSFLILNNVLNLQIGLFIWLLLVYFGYKICLTLAKLILLENLSDISGKDVKLYHRIQWIFFIGLLFSGLTVITHQLPVAYEAKILIDRLFMIFILIIALQLLKAKSVLPNLIENVISIHRRYVYKVLRLLSFLIPLALFFNAILGLCGYIELAWTIAKYQIIFFIGLTTYLIVRGLLIDFMEFISEIFIRYIKQGWLWAESLLKPIDRILRLGLFVFSGFVVLHFYGLDENANFINLVQRLLIQKLFSLGGNEITPLILIELLAIVLLIHWIARWSREFSFRWLYAKAKDVGVRNSLSIFTQYISVIVAVLVALRFLGINLKGFTVVAAAFAAGIGFGMRDLITNFFSGILLLIERPFRTGDIITLGTYEGEVVHTGMRSLTIRTWDHMDVIVPNADMFTKAFVNWTHHDNIVRSVINLKIHRDDDPHRIQRIILEVLKAQSNVVSHPSPEVILNEITDSVIELQVRYYIALEPHCSRVGIRSEVLLAIWNCFKINNIRVPNPEYDLVLKNTAKESSLSPSP